MEQLGSDRHPGGEAHHQARKIFGWIGQLFEYSPKYEVGHSNANSGFEQSPLPGIYIMEKRLLHPGDTPVDSHTHRWLMTIGNIAYFIPRM